MDRQTLEKLLEIDMIKNDFIVTFHIKACNKIIDEYGGKSGDWYVGSNRPDDGDNIELPRPYLEVEDS